MGDVRPDPSRAMCTTPTIAVAFFGMPRCSAATVPSIEARILQPLRECARVRVTYHLFHQLRIDNPRSGEAGELDPSNYDFVAPYAGRLEAPPDLRDTAVYEIARQRGDYWHDAGKSLHNLLLQLRSLESVWREVQTHDPDAVVFLRPDLLYHDAIDLGLVRYIARHPWACAVPDWQWHHGCNDRFAICGRRAATVYATRAQLIEEWCRVHRGPFESEALLAFALRRGGARVLAMPLRASRVRIGGTVQAEPFTSRCSGSLAVKLRHWRSRLAYALLRFQCS